MSETPQEELAQGHLFRFTVQSKGVSRVVGDSTWTEANWWGDPWAIEVRAFSLVSALIKVADLTDESLAAWDMNHGGNGG